MFIARSRVDLLLIDVLGVDPRAPISRGASLFVGEGPVVEIPSTGAQICSEAQPTKVWSNAPSRDGLNLRPDVCQVANSAG